MAPRNEGCLLYEQPMLPISRLVAIDAFAGGGGVSSAYEQATGMPVDLAINHDDDAISMHRANHPYTKHLISDIFEVDPRQALGELLGFEIPKTFKTTAIEGVGWFWASPDCTDHSKAKGGQPIRTRMRRALAWVVKRWAGTVQPLVIQMENVEEWEDWGPLVAKRKWVTDVHTRGDGSTWQSKRLAVVKVDPETKKEVGVAARGEVVPLGEQALVRDKRRKGETFRQFVRSLRELGYEVEWQERRCSGWGAPTIRKRLFLQARCDGQPIVWPADTHGDPRSEAVRRGILKPWRTTAECINLNEPMASIFLTPEEAKAWGKLHDRQPPKRPLADNSHFRIARGTVKFVIDCADRYLARRGRNGEWEEVSDAQVGSEARSAFFANLAHAARCGGSKRWGVGVRGLNEPYQTISCNDDMALLATALVPRYGERRGQASRVRSVNIPSPTVVTTGNGGSLMAASLVNVANSKTTGRAPNVWTAREPLRTIATSNGFALTGYQLTTYHGPKPDGSGAYRGGSLEDPIATLDTSNRYGLVSFYMGQNNGGWATGNSGDGHSFFDPASSITGKGANQSLIGVFIDQANGGWANRSGHSVFDPLSTILTQSRGHHGMLACAMAKFRGTSVDASVRWPCHTISAGGFHHSLFACYVGRDFGQSIGSSVRFPVGTITGGGMGKASLIGAYLTKYYGEGIGQSVRDPLHTIPCVDRFGLVTVLIGGQRWVIFDILMRMLRAYELYLCQGFRPGYIIDHGHDGRVFTETQKVHMCGNSVPPPAAEALIRANIPQQMLLRTPKEIGMARRDGIRIVEKREVLCAA